MFDDALDAEAPETTGRLLVATPSLVDPNFTESVVLIIEHGDEGAFGLVINRPSPVPVRETLPRWASDVSEPEVFFAGGPVDPDGVLGLALVPSDADEHLLAARIGRIGLVDVSRDPADVREVVGGLRLFAGHSGWGPGQLEAEIATGSWFVIDGAPDDAFSRDPEDLWRRVLARQGGVFSTVTADPSSN